MPGAKRPEETNNCLTGKAKLVPQLVAAAPGMEFTDIHAIGINHDSISGNSEPLKVQAFGTGDDEDQVGSALIDSLESL